MTILVVPVERFIMALINRVFCTVDVHYWGVRQIYAVFYSGDASSIAQTRRKNVLFFFVFFSD